MPSSLKRAIHKVEDSLALKGGKVDKKALKQVQDWWVEGSYKDGTLAEYQGKAMVSTTQAVDIIYGGLKINALVNRVMRVSMVYS
jgi:Gly-Xaa carboxypeptidase